MDTGQNENIKIKAWLQFLITVAGIINYHFTFFAIQPEDRLTEDKRYTLSQAYT
jgi:hypothetical protein